MQKKRLLIILGCLALILALGATTALAESPTQRPEGPGIFGGPGGHFGKFQPDMENLPEERLKEMDEEMTAEMAAEMAAKRAEMEAQMEAQMKARMEEQQAQWDAVPEADKQEILDLQLQMLQTQQQLLNKYLELGLLEADAAEMMQEHISEMLQNLDEGNIAPAMGWPGAGGFGQRAKPDFPGFREEGMR